ncbi:MAG: Hsp20/alpha crystallin family protein [Phycisphaerales bacterium]|nr:Hsp20/alpha crystallin family protein [Phycisphaerales bacterium]
MNLIPWNRRNPADGDLVRFRHEVDNMFNRFFNDPWGAIEPKFRSEGWLPAVDVSENDAEVTVRAEMPGVETKDLDINILGNTLSIAGKKEEKKEQKGENYYQCERRFGSFRRSVDLPETIDADKITADAENGVVTVHVPKKPGMKPRHVDIKPSGRKVPLGA